MKANKNKCITKISKIESSSLNNKFSLGLFTDTVKNGISSFNQNPKLIAKPNTFIILTTKWFLESNLSPSKTAFPRILYK